MRLVGQMAYRKSLLLYVALIACTGARLTQIFEKPVLMSKKILWPVKPSSFGISEARLGEGNHAGEL